MLQRNLGVTYFWGYTDDWKTASTMTKLSTYSNKSARDRCKHDILSCQFKVDVTVKKQTFDHIQTKQNLNMRFPSCV